MRTHVLVRYTKGILFAGGNDMARADTFSFRLSEEDRRRLARIARRLERSQSDAIRWLIRHAAREMEAGMELVGEEVKK